MSGLKSPLRIKIKIKENRYLCWKRDKHAYRIVRETERHYIINWNGKELPYDKKGFITAVTAIKPYEDIVKEGYEIYDQKL